MISNLRHLFFVFCIGISACQTPAPKYQLDILQGNWLRISSTDPRSDSLLINVQNDSAKVLFAPNTSDFTIGQKKWSNLSPIVENGDFELYDLSGDGRSWKAAITMNSDSTLELKNLSYPNAPGAWQSWIKIP